ncbi:MAG: hypothetical protein HAW67_01160 [Endozoicomonadaceae bacterium]|nr:hypothetical protein [Endozoicomonadaceae bacterium]
MEFEQIGKNVPFHQLLAMLIQALKKPKAHQASKYFLFTQEEAAIAYNIISLFYIGRTKVSVSFYYDNQETIAFKPYSTRLSHKMSGENVKFLVEDETQIRDIIKDQTKAMTAKDINFIREHLDPNFELKQAG